MNVIFIGKSSNLLENASMLTLTKEVTNKDRSLTTQLAISSKNREEKISGERVWRNEGVFKETKQELNLEKKNVLENCLLYIDQSWLGDLAMYHHNFIIGQLIVAANQLPQMNQYVCKDNEVKLYTCMYNLQTGEFLGLRCEVAFIVLMRVVVIMRIRHQKIFNLCSTLKQKLPDVFMSTSFKKHYSEIMNEWREKEDFSTRFFLSSFYHG